MNKQTLMNMIRSAALAAMAAIPGMCCSYSVSMPAIGSGGGVVAVAVNTSANCAWDLTHSQTWLSAYGSQHGVGPGYVYLYASAYGGRTARTQPIHVTVTSPCNSIGTRSTCVGTVIAASTTAVQY